MESNNKQYNFWLKICILLVVIILLLSGFAFGYLYGDKSCIENPLLYGVKKLDEINKDNYTCRCYSINNEGFSFNAEGIIKKDINGIPLLGVRSHP